jgi:hypothetical protein
MRLVISCFSFLGATEVTEKVKNKSVADEKQKNGHITLARRKSSRPHHNHLTSINAEIDRRDDGDIRIAGQISNI